MTTKTAPASGATATAKVKALSIQDWGEIQNDWINQAMVDGVDVRLVQLPQTNERPSMAMILLPDFAVVDGAITAKTEDTP